ncbi:hypothetical protein NEI02_07560 [Brachyspira pilosicoli]|uniref:Lipocalin-like domain-containing protein n=1 Tax=Brachyspira pilosicoli TaxID=52584 RepID=A0AAJ6KD47_BRAPL|nr:hypothetical protein [Brachyspira pilosicoli]WIH89560.1 hypothetical protein NEI02_07560 [Brachyspira pilosicoli]WIH91855.1 hypothetical protein NEI01_07560 [Brachyspira pilosicoli]WIH94084.1 hypothetical protein NEH99_07240 [Brachyspira pilosicoli]
MKKKLISILFLTAILFVSCSNENKTGPSSNNNNDLKYSGSWTFTNTPNYKGGVLTINKDGSCIINNKKAESFTKNSENNYIIVFKETLVQEYVTAVITLTLDITFDTENSGTVKINEKAISEDGTELHNADVNEIITKNI